MIVQNDSSGAAFTGCTLIPDGSAALIPLRFCITAKGVRLAHGEFKTPGGKLVIVDFATVDGRIEDVAVSGDFFLEPPEALDLINAALDGQPASLSESDLAKAIADALPGGVEMVGFSPEAVAIAIRRGME